MSREISLPFLFNIMSKLIGSTRPQKVVPARIMQDFIATIGIGDVLNDGKLGIEARIEFTPSKKTFKKLFKQFGYGRTIFALDPTQLKYVKRYWGKYKEWLKRRKVSKAKVLHSFIISENTEELKELLGEYYDIDYSNDETIRNTTTLRLFDRNLMDIIFELPDHSFEALNKFYEALLNGEGVLAYDYDSTKFEYRYFSNKMKQYNLSEVIDLSDTLVALKSTYINQIQWLLTDSRYNRDPHSKMLVASNAIYGKVLNRFLEEVLNAYQNEKDRISFICQENSIVDMKIRYQNEEATLKVKLYANSFEFRERFDDQSNTYLTNVMHSVRFSPVEYEDCEMLHKILTLNNKNPRYEFDQRPLLNSSSTARDFDITFIKESNGERFEYNYKPDDFLNIKWPDITRIANEIGETID